MSNTPQAVQAQKAREQKERKKKLEQEAKQQEKERLEKIQKEEKELEDKFGPFINYCRKHNLKEKESLWADKRIKYARCDELVDFISEHYKEIQKLLPEFEWEEEEKKSKKEKNEIDYDIVIWNLLTYLLDWGVLMRFERAEEPQSTEKKKKKYPKRLLYNNVQFTPGSHAGTFDKCFFKFGIEMEHKRLKLYSILFISLITFICLFPVWPLIMKKGVFYFSLYSLIFLIGFIIVRLVIYLCFRTLGWSFWVLPNIFDDNLGFIDQFRPFISSEWNEDGWILYLIRVLLFIWLILAGFYVYHERLSILENTGAAIDDITEWGLKKMQNENLPSRALPGYESFAEPEEDKQANNKTDTVINQENEQVVNENENLQKQQEENNEQQQQNEGNEKKDL